MQFIPDQRQNKEKRVSAEENWDKMFVKLYTVTHQADLITARYIQVFYSVKFQIKCVINTNKISGLVKDLPGFASCQRKFIS